MDSMSKIRIVALKNEHLRSIVAIHLEAFPGFFLTFLGANFLRVYYGSFIKENSGICWVAEDEISGRILGAVFGTAAPGGFYRKLAGRRWWAFGWAGLSAVVRKPSILKRLFRALSYRGDPPGNSEFALLSSVAVAPEAQGRGVGKALLHRWVEEAKYRMIPGAYLTTDAVGNEAVNRFYRLAGWTIESVFLTPEGRKMNRYILRFDRDEI